MSTGLIMFALIGGLIIFMLMEHPVIFWLIVVPIVAIVAIKFIAWLKK